MQLRQSSILLMASRRRYGHARKSGYPLWNGTHYYIRRRWQPPHACAVSYTPYRSKVPLSSVVFENHYKSHISAIENTYAPQRGCLRPATFLLHLALAQTYMERAAENHDVSLYDNTRMSIFAGLAAVGVVRKRTLIGNGTYIPIASDNLPCTGPRRCNDLHGAGRYDISLPRQTFRGTGVGTCRELA